MVRCTHREMRDHIQAERVEKDHIQMMVVMGLQVGTVVEITKDKIRVGLVDTVPQAVMVDTTHLVVIVEMITEVQMIMGHLVDTEHLVDLVDRAHNLVEMVDTTHLVVMVDTTHPAEMVDTTHPAEMIMVVKEEMVAAQTRHTGKMEVPHSMMMTETMQASVIQKKRNVEMVEEIMVVKEEMV